MSVEIKKTTSLKSLIHIVSEHELMLSSTSERLTIRWIIGHATSEDYSKILDDGTDEEKETLFYILSNLWTLQAIRTFMKRHQRDKEEANKCTK